jgi:hypothetical protein
MALNESVLVYPLVQVSLTTTIHTSKSTLSEGPMATSHVCVVGKYPQEPY